ncbi:MAG: glucoamylase family protein [Saprospiraceae bacterium]|nr:glucoamylase family protein [Saprospiraceae bacterium]
MHLSLIVALFCFMGCSKPPVEADPLNFKSYSIDGVKDNFNYSNASALPVITLSFTSRADPNAVDGSVHLYTGGIQVPITTTLFNSDSSIRIVPRDKLEHITKYTLQVTNQLRSAGGVNLSSSVEASFITRIDSSDKFSRIPDDSLLNLIQRQTFKYFWDFAHPVSGLARERNTSGDIVTSGGSGFGVMCILVGIKRGFISRQQGLERLSKIVDFLKNKTKRHHGVFPHWLNGATGETIPFSQKDDGGDLVETSYLIAGLLAAKEYFDGPSDGETKLRNDMVNIFETVEWNWHTKGSDQVLYWHWSPKYNWEMNHELRGWNEALITYVLAASSPTYPISKVTYDQGWARNGAMKNNKTFYNIPLPLGPDLGGPLFFAHYTFLGIDPGKLKDPYADYWSQVVNHTKINYEYCKANPKKFNGYSASCWGLTASDTKNGYDAHSPTNDKGVITPTAALASLPFTPKPSMDALRFFYYTLGDKLYKQYGFVDAFNLSEPWFASSFLAIDQGPIIIMIENYRSGMIWEYTMKNKDIQSGLTKLGFSY